MGKRKSKEIESSKNGILKSAKAKRVKGMFCCSDLLRLAIELWMRSLGDVGGRK